MKDRNSLSKTDESATFMHLKEDHMRNSQLKPAYNVQIAVDAEYIVATEIFNDSQPSGAIYAWDKSGVKRENQNWNVRKMTSFVLCTQNSEKF